MGSLNIDLKIGIKKSQVMRNPAVSFLFFYPRRGLALFCPLLSLILFPRLQSLP